MKIAEIEIIKIGIHLDTSLTKIVWMKSAIPNINQINEIGLVPHERIIESPKIKKYIFFLGILMIEKMPSKIKKAVMASVVADMKLNLT